MPCSLKAASRRLRRSPAAAHWSARADRAEDLERDAVRLQRLHALDAWRLEDAPLPDRIAGHLATDVVDDLDRLVDVGAVGDGHVLVDPRPDPGQVGRHVDLAVGDGVDDAVEVAQRRPPQGEVLDRPRHAGEAHDVARPYWFSIRISAPLR